MQLLDRHAIQNRLPLEESGCVFGRANSESKNHLFFALSQKECGKR